MCIMRRTLTQTGIFVLLGAVANVVFAWGVPSLVHERWERPLEEVGGGRRLDAKNRRFATIEYRGVAMTLVDSCQSSAMPTNWSTDYKPPRWVETPYACDGYDIWDVDARALELKTYPDPFPSEIHVAWGGYGWPWRAFRGGFIHTRPLYRGGTEAVPAVEKHREGFLEVDGLAELIGTIPIRAIWPGLIGNSLAWAAILWFIWWSPAALRRLIRRRRGRCAHCGYDRRGLDGPTCCPECGNSRAVRP